jgi:hypothetical protein
MYIVLLILSTHGVSSLRRVPPDVAKFDVKGMSFGDNELTAAEYANMIKNFRPKLTREHMKMKAKKPIMFIHVHKSLGTWACKAAVSSGFNTPGGMSHDCTLGEDTPWHFKEFSYFDKQNTCAARHKMNMANNYTFEEVERHVDFEGGDICPDSMHTAVIFRSPVDRIKSQMSANMQTWDEVQEWIKNKEDLQHPHSFIKSHVPFDNFYIRSFIGRDFFLGSGKITRKHLEKAKENLARVDAVIDVNDLFTQVTQMEALMHVELQQMTSAMVHNDGCVDTTESECQKYALPEEGEKILKDMNALDYEFVEYARQVAKDKSIEFHPLNQ